MGENSKIEWTDHTFNPWIGCTKVSEGCKNCYAETLMDKLWNKVKWGKGKERKLTSEANWKLPLKWDAQAKKEGVRKKVFCASLADVFDTEVSDEWRDKLFKLINFTENLDWLLLTKRPENAKRYIDNYIKNIEDEAIFISVGSKKNKITETPIENIWLGVSVENQKAANERIPILLKIPAKIRFLSCEPLLGNIDLGKWMGDYDCHMCNLYSGIDWIIAGGESGHNARPVHPDWIRLLRDQCQAANVKFLFKQWGGKDKKKAGRLLDGREWNEFPKYTKGRIRKCMN